MSLQPEATAVTARNKPYRPAGACRELIHVTCPEVLIEGPAGTGKSRAVLEKLNILALDVPDIRILLVRKTRKSLNETILELFENHVVPDWPFVKTRQQRANRESYAYPKGGKIVLGGLDNVERIMSSEYDVVAAFETTELTEHDWEMLLSRLRAGNLPYQQAIAECNPGAPTHWLNLRANTERMERLRSRHEDNPRVTPAYLERLRALTGVRYERLYLGRWCATEGAVWSEWDAAVHLVDPLVIPDSWARYRSIDFGYENPFCCQWWATDEDGRLYLYRELYMSRRTVAKHARQINELTGDEAIAASVADHDSEDRATLSEAGIITIPARKAVSVGIQRVAERLKVAGDGRPRLSVFRDALVERDPRMVDAKLPCCTAEEIESYVWKPSPDGMPGKEQPDKQRCADHGCDALRYMTMHLDGGKPVGIIGLNESAELTQDEMDEQEAHWMPM